MNFLYIYTDLAQIYIKTGKLDEAKDKLKTAIKIATDNIQKYPPDQISRIALNKANTLLEELKDLN